MAKPKHKPFAPGIFGFEGDPEKDLKQKYSVQPILRFLETLNGTKYIFRDIGTTEELQHYLTRWTLKRFAEYRVGYFSFHGGPGELVFPDERRSSITLDDLGAWLEGRAQDRVILFCACSVLKIDDEHLLEFKRRTKAYAVMGYLTDVDWSESMAFEILLFSAMHWYTRFGDAMNYVDRVASKLRDHLGFKIIR